MKKLFAAAVVSLLTILCTSAWAASKTVTLSVPGMTCAACPITIKKALTDVDGVTDAEVSFDKKEAVVTFDDTKTVFRPSSRPPRTRGTHRVLAQ